VNSRVLGVSEFTYIIGNFEGPKRVTMATEFKQTSTKIALISVLFKKWKILTVNSSVFWVRD